MKGINKRYIYVIIGLIISFFLFFFIYGINSIKNYRNDETLILSDDVAFRKYKGKWGKINSHKNLNWKKYHIYINNEYFDDQYLYYNEKWYIFKKDKTAIPYNGDILAFNSDYKVINFNTTNINFDKYIKKVLNDNKANNYGIDSSYYSDLDLDSDGILERIYVISNRFSKELDSGMFFSYIFLVKDGKITYIYKDSSIDNNSYEGCKPYISNIIDIDNDNKYEIVIACSYYSDEGTNYKLYKYHKGKFNLLVSN